MLVVVSRTARMKVAECLGQPHPSNLAATSPATTTCTPNLPTKNIQTEIR